MKICNKLSNKLWASGITFVLFMVANISFAQNIVNLNVLEGGDGTIQNSWLLKRLTVQFDQRRAEIKEASQSAEKLLARRDSMRKWFIDKVGELPPRTQLNPKFGAKVDMGGYTVATVYFESQPNHHVTGLYYTPTSGKPPYPAVYIPSGHSLIGKSSKVYQRAARLFALNGFAVLQTDPVGQAERQQYLDKEGNPIYPDGGMLTHEILGQSLLLTGSNSLIHELFDNIRGIDFLVQQASVDKDKIVVVGNSGGGTQTTYLAAYDRRIKVAIPSCYIATTEKKFNTIGSQDGCQQLWGEGRAGIEEQDFLFMAAPIPILISSAQQDFFNIDGAVSAYKELKGLYKILGHSEKITQEVIDSNHGWQLPLQEAAVQWCKKWLMDDLSPITESVIVGDYDTIHATSSGQVLTSFPDESLVSDISTERMKKARILRSEFQNTNRPVQISEAVKNLCGFEEPAGEIGANVIGTFQGKGYSYEKLLIVRDYELKFDLPGLLFIPDDADGKSSAVIIVSEHGKDTVLTPNCQIMKEIRKGNIVLAIDLSNTGELKYHKKLNYNNEDFWMGKLALYEGKTLMTYRAEELIMAKRFLQNHLKISENAISIYSTGSTGPAALHAAYFDHGFRQVTINGSINTWEDVASASFSKDQLANIVPNALSFYDLPDLIHWMPKTEVVIIAPVNALGEKKE